MNNTKSGRRQKLRQQFLAGEATSRCDEAMLELLLTFAIPRRDVRPLAQELIRVFGGLSQVLEATCDELGRVEGIGPAAIALLKAVEFIRSDSGGADKNPSLRTQTAAGEQTSFNDLLEEPGSDQASPGDGGGGRPEPEEASAPNAELPKSRGTAAFPVCADSSSVLQSSSPSSDGTPVIKKSPRGKLQVSRSHLLEFNHFSRILSLLYEYRGMRKISRKLLSLESGLPDGQVESLISIGASMALIQPNSQILTPIGSIVAEHDVFLDRQGTLEWCHYKGAGSVKNLVWFDVFNYLLPEEVAMTQPDWESYFFANLQGRYTIKTLKRHVPQEVRFLVDAYMEGNFRKLELLHESSDGCLYGFRYTRFVPAVLCAMIYDFCAAAGINLAQMDDIVRTPGSPASVFGLDTASFREQVEGLHERGWLRYETTHNLDQIRLRPGFSAHEFICAYFEDREPKAS